MFFHVVDFFEMMLRCLRSDDSADYQLVVSGFDGFDKFAFYVCDALFDQRSRNCLAFSVLNLASLSLSVFLPVRLPQMSTFFA